MLSLKMIYVSSYFSFDKRFVCFYKIDFDVFKDRKPSQEQQS